MPQFDPGESELAVFDDENACGFVVKWSEQGTGFGEFTIAVTKKSGEVVMDAEGMGPKWIGRMLMRLVGTEIIAVADQTPHMTTDDPEIVAMARRLIEEAKKGRPQ